MSDAALADDQGSRRVERKNLTPEQEIEATRKALEVSTAQVKSLEGTVATTTAHAAKVGSAASEAALAQINEREVSLGNAIKAAQTAEGAAKSAWKAAREAGNIDAEQEATERMTDAKVELRVLSEQKAAFDRDKERMTKDAKALATPPATGQSSESAKWIAEHPLFNTDAQYKQDALDAHELAVVRKIPIGTAAYTTFLNQQLARIHGADHGKPKAAGGGGQQQQQREQQVQNDGGGSSTALPPGRELQGSFEHQEGGASLRLIRGADGKKQISGTIPGAWREAAKWNNMSEIDYAISQMEIREEAASGRSAGVQMGDGMMYR